MARRKIVNIMTCPFCNQHVYYWPNYCPRTSCDFGNVGWVQTKRGTRIYFHNSCYWDDVRSRNDGKE